MWLPEVALEEDTDEVPIEELQDIEEDDVEEDDEAELRNAIFSMSSRISEQSRPPSGSSFSLTANISRLFLFSH